MYSPVLNPATRAVWGRVWGGAGFGGRRGRRGRGGGRGRPSTRESCQAAVSREPVKLVRQSQVSVSREPVNLVRQQFHVNP